MLAGAVVVEAEPSRNMFLTPPSDLEVSNLIATLKNNSAAGHDGIGPKVIKTLRHKLVPILTHLISIIFATGVFPDIFKRAVVTPIHKAGSRSMVDNFRPISVLPVVSKIVEKALHRRLLIYMNRHLNLLYDHQFGFRPECSAENAAIELVSSIARTIDGGKVATGIFMDLKKAFDLVDHQMLLEVLEKYGLKNKELALFRSYLDNRTQVVKIGDTTGPAVRISSGVIQGSCLGPLLFLVFINAIGSLGLRGRLFLFADDAALINTHNKNDDISAVMQEDMTTVLKFFKNRRMVLNASKTNFMVFTSNRNLRFPDVLALGDELEITRTKSFKYLGLIISENLDWKEHLRNVQKKLAPASGILWKLGNVLPLSCRKIIYDALLQSHINYMVPIWGLAPDSTINNAQILQNRALRSFYSIHSLEHRDKMYAHLVENHLPIRACCLVGITTYTYNVINGKTHSNLQFTSSQLIHGRNLRERNPLRPAQARTNYGHRSLETFGPMLFNKVPPDIQKLHHQHAFKWSLKCQLRNEQFIRTCFTADFLKLKFLIK